MRRRGRHGRGGIAPAAPARHRGGGSVALVEDLEDLAGAAPAICMTRTPSRRPLLRADLDEAKAVDELLGLGEGPSMTLNLPPSHWTWMPREGGRSRRS